MLECVECSTKIDLMDLEESIIIDCPGCGIELEIIEEDLVGLQLGPSEE